MNKFLSIAISITAASVLLAVAIFDVFTPTANAQTENTDLFRVGERLTYNISFGRFENVAFAETFVVSRGKVAKKDAIEIQTRMKTLNFIVVDFLLVDIFRTVLAAPSDGTPIYVKDLDSSNGAPVETVTNFADKGGVYDLSTIIYKIRASSGTGAFEIVEGDKRYGVTFTTAGAENVSTTAGEFPTSIIDVQSPFLTERGITNLKINLATEGSKVPVQFRAKTAKGDFRALVASIQVATPEATPTPTPTTLPTQATTPTPKPTPTPYIDNEPLSGMPFELGEVLNYSVKSGARNLGTVQLSAKERRLISGRDTLILKAEVTNALTADIFRLGNGIRSNVSPETLSPYDVDLKFDGPLAGFNQTARFDWGSSKAVFGANTSVDVPIGTHSILSLIYAMRQFNLHQSKDLNNPINDMRVAVFWQGKANVFTLRPGEVQTITLGQQKLAAQKVAVNTGVPQLDALRMNVWFSEDDRRTPLRLTLGAYQLDLILPDPESIP